MLREQTTRTRWLALVAITAIALYLCWLILAPFVDVLLWAIALVILFYPAHERIVAVTARPGLSALLSLLIVIVAFVVPIVFVVTSLVREVSGVAGSAEVQSFIVHPDRNPRLQRILDLAQPYVDIRQLISPENIKSVLGRASQVLVQGTVGVVGGALGIVVKFIFVLFTMFYLFRDARPAIHHLSRMLPLDEANSNAILARTHEVIYASVIGVLVIAAIQGTLGGLAFWALGVPSPILWGVLMTLLSMIPMVGSGLVWVPTAVILGVSGHWGKALFLALWGSLVIGTLDNFLRPRLVGGQAQMHPLVIFFSVLGGLQVFGMLGILLGPVIVAVTLSLIRVFREIESRPSSDVPVA